jgi:hypothetical protein
MAAKTNSQPSNPATPTENVRGSTIAKTPQTNTTTAEAINHRLARFTSMSTLSDSNEFITKVPRILALMMAIEQHIRFGDFWGYFLASPQRCKKCAAIRNCREARTRCVPEGPR